MSGNATAVTATIATIDSHTEGESTRVVVGGWPTLVGKTMAERRTFLVAQHDHLRCGALREPRGRDGLVGALLTPPVEPGSICGVVFFNDVGGLGMCCHGLIGVVRTLKYLGRVAGGVISVDTPVGTVSAVLDDDGTVTVRSLPVQVKTLGLQVKVPEYGWVIGDVAGGGNWFFITDLPDESLELANVRRLTEITTRIRDALRMTGSPVDYVELSGPPAGADADARNFVLCPGAAYDRSPCGMGTSALMAARHAHGRLALGARWRQESITGTLFTGWLASEGDALVSSIQGSAYITAVSTLRFEAQDPLRAGRGA